MTCRIGFANKSNQPNQIKSGCKNLDQSKSGKPKTTNSESALQVIEENPVSSTLGVSGNLGIPQSSVFCHHHDSSSSIPSCQMVLHISLYWKTFYSL